MRVGAHCVGSALLLFFRILTAAWHRLRALLCMVLPDCDRAPKRLPEGPRFLSVDGRGQLVGLDRLPEVPQLPEGAVETLCISGCANVAMYTLGAAYALQKAPNYKEAVRRGELRTSGSSSGAFVAAPFAMGLDCSNFMRICWLKFTEHRRRVGGCIGIYSTSVRGVLRRAMRGDDDDGNAPQRQRSPDELARDLGGGRLTVGVTRFNPWPEHVSVGAFSGEQELLDVVLASCHIPVAYETPVVLGKGLGFCIDGCALDFLPEADVVISPFHCHAPEIGPLKEYPGSMNFSLLHGEDILRLFEDGYLDAVRWLKAGAPSRRGERETTRARPLISHRLLVSQGFRVALSALGWR